MSQASLCCRSCGSTNVIEDDLYAQTQLVCVDCGSVVSEGVLDKDPFGGSGGNMVETGCQRGQTWLLTCFASWVVLSNIDLFEMDYSRDFTLIFAQTNTDLPGRL